MQGYWCHFLVHFNRQPTLTNSHKCSGHFTYKLYCDNFKEIVLKSNFLFFITRFKNLSFLGGCFWYPTNYLLLCHLIIHFCLFSIEYRYLIVVIPLEASRTLKRRFRGWGERVDPAFIEVLLYRHLAFRWLLS